MHPIVRFVLLLFFGLGLLAWATYQVLTRTTRGWFASDLDGCARLVIASARQSLVSHWEGDDRALGEMLAGMTRDERIVGIAACTDTGALRAATAHYPAEFSCGSIAARAQHEGVPPAGPWSMVVERAGGAVHATAIPLRDVRGPPGFVVLLHDLSFLRRREETTRNQVLLAFLVLSIGASVLTVLAAKSARRRWGRDLRRVLSGEANGDLEPLLHDVRDLVERLGHERDGEVLNSSWTADRLRSVLTQHLHGERIVVLANREPYIHQKTEQGETSVLHPASGLVTALEPVMRACSGVWVAHGSGSADRETVDSHDRIRVPPGEESYSIRRVWLTEQEELGYYYGLANEGLWPLCHIAHTRPEFRQQDWEQYRVVNQKFANVVCDEVDAEDSIVLVQDYHFALAPAMIRSRLRRATILSFWHIPWPNAERFGICPWRNEILQGLLGSSILGFHTQQHCNNFLDAVDTYLEARIDRENNAVIQRSRRTLVRAYPISIEWPIDSIAQMPSPEECRREVFRKHDLPDGAWLGVAVNRLDYTKGIEECLRAVDQLLTHHPEFRGRFVFAHLAAPTRSRIESYKRLETRVGDLAEKINERWAQGSYRPILLLQEHHERPTVFRYLRAAHVCYVSSLHDGMNLVAKEFVAARDDELGVLVLSQFAGAAKELTEALIVNPYDFRQTSDALASALRMSAAEQHERMRSMRRLVAQLNVYRWAGRMLADAAKFRHRQRLSKRLSTPPASREVK